MAGIRSKNTKPEWVIRRGLHARGFRYRLHVSLLPGHPDLVFTSRKAVLFINGCFWHGHECRNFRWPVQRAEFWRNKIEANRHRDSVQLIALSELGWRTATIWECAVKVSASTGLERLFDSITTWLDGNQPHFEISGESDEFC